VLVDEYGTLVNREEYYPFGETSFGSYAKKRYRFCGKEKDEESGLYYYGARYYAPWLCRFVSVDPLAGKYVFQSAYAYADNNPINKMDYNGEGTEKTDVNLTGQDTVQNESKIDENTNDDNINGGKLNIIVDEPDKPAEAREKIKEYETSDPEKAKELQAEWDKYDKEFSQYNKLLAIKKRIEDSTAEKDPVIFKVKQILMNSNGEKNIHLKAAQVPLYDKDENGNNTGTRLFGKTIAITEDTVYILFDLEYIEAAPGLNRVTDALNKARFFMEKQGVPNDPKILHLDIGGVITHELGHAADFFSKNGFFCNKSKSIEEKNPQQYEYEFYIQKHLPAFWKK
jgi:RHS repeat-associated protein